MFKRFRSEVGKQTGKSIKMYRYDRGGEYHSDDFINYLKVNEIIS